MRGSCFACSVLATRETLRIMEARYGPDFAGSRQEATLGEAMRIGDTTVTFQPAGHVLGSAQIAVEADGFRIVPPGWDFPFRPDHPGARHITVVLHPSRYSSCHLA